MHRKPARATVLIVDRDEDSRLVYRPLLEGAGFEVLEAGDGTTGLSLALQRVPAVVITELTLTGMDGFELIRGLRAGRGGTRVIVLTARRIQGDREAAMAAGCTRFLEKPVAPQVLVREVSMLLDRAAAPLPSSPA